MPHGDIQNTRAIRCWHTGITVGSAPHSVITSGLEYADDAALLDSDVYQASNILHAISHGSKNDAAMKISLPTTKVMHIHKKGRVSQTMEEKKSQLWEFSSRVQASHGSFPQSVAWLYTKAAGTTEVITFAQGRVYWPINSCNTTNGKPKKTSDLTSHWTIPK